MFFLLSKTIGYLVRPLVIIALVLIAHLLIKNQQWKKRLLVTGLILFFFFSNKFLANEMVRLFEAPIVPLSELASREKPYELGILLTGVTSGNKILKDRVYITVNADRVNHTVMLYKKGYIKKILISGGTGKLINPTFSEAEELNGVFQYMGIPKEDILIEGKSRNTYESAVAVRKILPDADGSSYLLITSATHIPRAIGCFKKQGLNCDVFPTDINFKKREYTPDILLFPNLEALEIWEDVLKEITGILAYRLVGYI